MTAVNSINRAALCQSCGDITCYHT